MWKLQAFALFRPHELVQGTDCEVQTCIEHILLVFKRLLGVGSALAVLCELNIHSLPRSTNQAGKKRNARMQEVLVFCFFFFLSSISSVCMRENKGMRVASEQHYAHCVPWSVEYPWTPRWSEVSNWCWTLWWIQVIESRSGWKHLNLGCFNPELKLHSKDRNEVTVPCCNSVFCVSK